MSEKENYAIDIDNVTVRFNMASEKVKLEFTRNLTQFHL